MQNKKKHEQRKNQNKIMNCAEYGTFLGENLAFAKNRQGFLWDRIEKTLDFFARKQYNRIEKRDKGQKSILGECYDYGN